MEVLLAAAIASVLDTSAEPVSSDLRHISAFLTQSNLGGRYRFQPVYHLSAPACWLSDPAAFIFFKRKYHLFYQCHPYDGAWGASQWGHAASRDLVTWAHYPPAVLPNEPYDLHGCLAGSAFDHNDYLVIFYTGQTIINNVTRYSQSIAISADAVLFKKYLYNPVLKQQPPHVTEWLNPKVWRHCNVLQMLIGASMGSRGALLRYVSPDLYSWRANGTAASSLGDMGLTWESPELFMLDGLCVLLLSAKGAPAELDGTRFRNLQQSGYMIGEFDCHHANLDDLEVSTATFEELDHGHDFYAAKTTRAADGRRLLVAWMGMWESRFEESVNGWAGMMTLMRELRVGLYGRIEQSPVREAVGLRTEMMENAFYAPMETFEAGTRSFELLVNATSAAEDVGLALEWSGGRQYTVLYWAERGRVGVDRGGADGARQADWAPAPSSHLHWRLFVDRSSVEVFIGEGEVVFSSRVYPRGSIRVRVLAQTPLHITQYRLRRSIGYDPKINKYLKDNFLI